MTRTSLGGTGDYTNDRGPETVPGGHGVLRSDGVATEVEGGAAERATGGSWDYGQMAWNVVGGGRANFASPLRSARKVDLVRAPCSRRLRALRSVAKNNDTTDAIWPPPQLPPVALSSILRFRLR